MKNFFKLWKRNSLTDIVIAVFNTAIFLSIAWLIDGRITDPGWSANIWYWSTFISYLVWGWVISENYYGRKPHDAWFMANICLIAISLIAFIIHFFHFLPLPIQALCGWTAIISIVVLIAATILSILFLGFNDDPNPDKSDWEEEYEHLYEE
jgi:hypothetical protein